MQAFVMKNKMEARQISIMLNAYKFHVKMLKPCRLYIKLRKMNLVR